MAYYYYDAQGNLGVVADVYGNSTDSYAYDAWGAIAEHSGSSDEQYTYVGKYGVSMEPDDGLLMMGVRFYDPELGVFLQKDPFPGYLVDPTTLHPYMYTRNDPVNKIDPTGENWFTDKWNEYVAKPAESIYNSVASAANKGKEKVSRGIANAREIYQKFQEKRQARWKNAGARGKERAAAQGTRKDTGILNRINERFFGGQLNQLNNRYIAPYGEDIASGVVSITPGVGDAKDWQEVITARDLVTNKELSTFDQGVTVFAAFLPLVGGKVVREILGEAVEDTLRVRHYTNRKGINGIEGEGIVRAKDNNRVYVEPANKKPLSPIQAQDTYQLGKGKGRDYVEFDVPNSQLEWVKNPRYGTPELTVNGDVNLNNPNFVRRK